MGKAVKGHFSETFSVPLHDQLPCHRIQSLIILVMINKKLVGDYVLSPIKKDALRRFPVTSCSSCLLVIGFHIFRHIIMDDKTHIGLVNSHSKGIGSHHDPHIIIDKLFLVVLSLCIT